MSDRLDEQLTLPIPVDSHEHLPPLSESIDRYETPTTADSPAGLPSPSLSDYSPALPTTGNFSGWVNRQTIPNTDDLEKLKNILGDDWRNLALVISTCNGNVDMIGISKTEAEHKVKKYFSSMEKMKNETFTHFDVTLFDLAVRIQILVSADVHWLCLARNLSGVHDSQPGNVYLSRLFTDVLYFDTFWAVLSMPHYEKQPRNEPTIFQNEIESRITDGLTSVKNEVKKQISGNFYSTEYHERKKFCRFISQDKLVHYACDVPKEKLIQKCIQMSTMKVDEIDWVLSVSAFGFNQDKFKETPRHFCVLFDVVKSDLIGEKVLGTKYNGEGTMGWPLTKGGNDYQITSLHVLLGEDRLKELEKKGNSNQLVEMKHGLICKHGRFPVIRRTWSDCDLECCCIFNKVETYGLITHAAYEKGDTVNQAAGTEIVVVNIDKTNSNIRNLLGDSLWKRFRFPDILHFKGKIKTKEDVEIKTPVYKFGITTGLTKGYINGEESEFKFSLPFSNKEKPFTVTLLKQLEVTWENEEHPFSKEGDSGGPVFLIEENTKEMIGIGIVTGNNEKKQISYVTPLDQILKIIGNDFSLKQFQIDLIKKEITDFNLEHVQVT